jgi:hypothetical protein
MHHDFLRTPGDVVMCTETTHLLMCANRWRELWLFWDRGEPRVLRHGFRTGSRLESYRNVYLGFGMTWQRHGTRCTSRPTGLTCRNRRGHGFWFGRPRGYRVF